VTSTATAATLRQHWCKCGKFDSATSGKYWCPTLAALTAKLTDKGQMVDQHSVLPDLHNGDGHQNKQRVASTLKGPSFQCNLSLEN